MRIAVLALALSGVSEHAIAQTEPPLVGPARDIARAAIVYPVVLDPVLTLPLTPSLQAAVESHGRDVSGTVHLGVSNGDDSYGITVSGPLSRGDGTATAVDPRALRGRTFLGFDLTNIVWRPKAKPALERELGPEGFLRLSGEKREAIARTIAGTDAVDVPWVLFMNFSYRFNRAEYTYTDPSAAPRSETHLNDIAAALVGSQFLVRPNDPGYFVGFSYTYSAVFRESDPDQTVQTRAPVKVRGNLLRVELRRPLASAHLGVNPSWTYDLNSGVTTIDAATYRLFAPVGRPGTKSSTRLYAGVRVGYQRGQDGWFATVFVGPVFAGPPSR